MPRRLVSASLALALLATGAIAQPPKTKPAPAPQAPAKADQPAPAKDETPLKGPTVATPSARPTLVQRDFAGKVIRLEMSPAEAAVKLLKLDDATRAKVDAVIQERSALLDKIVTDNLELLVKLQGARENPDQKEYGRLTRELAEKSTPLAQRGALAVELAGVLPADANTELKRLIQEYWKAIVDEDTAKPASQREPSEMDQPPSAPASDPAAKREAMRDEVRKMTGLEVKRAYERTIGARARDFDALIKDLNLSPEQESKIRKIVGDSFQKTYGKETAQERSRIFWLVYQALDADQQKALIAKVSPHSPAAESLKPAK
jgi:hypothetical protein